MQSELDLEFVSLTKRYGDTLAVDAISYHFNENHKLAIDTFKETIRLAAEPAYVIRHEDLGDPDPHRVPDRVLHVRVGELHEDDPQGAR